MAKDISLKNWHAKTGSGGLQM